MPKLKDGTEVEFVEKMDGEDKVIIAEVKNQQRDERGNSVVAGHEILRIRKSGERVERAAYARFKDVYEGEKPARRAVFRPRGETPAATDDGAQ